GTGFIDLAAAGDVVLTNAGSVVYTAGTVSEYPSVWAPPTLTGYRPTSVASVQPQYPTDGGAVHVVAQNNVYGRAPGDQRISNQLITDWLFREGRLRANGTVSNVISWYPRFDRFKQGIGTLGGGDVRVRAGGNVDNLSVIASTSGRVLNASSAVPTPSDAEVLGGGDLSVSAGRHILGGVFYVGKGVGRIAAGGMVRPGDTVVTSTQQHDRSTLLALGDAEINLTAVGTVTVGNIFNPTLIPQVRANLGTRAVRTASLVSQFSTYGEKSAVKLTSLSDDVRINNNVKLVESISAVRADSYDRFDNLTPQNPIPDIQAFNVFPPAEHVTAFSGDVALVSDSVKLFPAPNGTLELLAGRSVDLRTDVFISGVGPSRFPSIWRPVDIDLDRLLVNTSAAGASGREFFSSPSLHANDTQPIRIVAGEDILGNPNNQHGFSKRALLHAGRDIRNFKFIGQNLSDTDVTSLYAGRDMIYELLDPKGRFLTTGGGVRVGGPGRVEVIAGRHVDLGASDGIVSVGNQINPFLSKEGADISVLAGIGAHQSYDAFIGIYLNVAPDSSVPLSERTLYAGWLTDYMRTEMVDPTLDTASALTLFRTLSAERQRPLLHRVLFHEVDVAGKAGSDPEGASFGDYVRGYRAIESMFPGYDAQGNRGNIQLFASQIKTESGGDIELLVPGGSVIAGLAANTAITKPAKDLGIISLGRGDILSVVRDSVLVNSSRIFALQGGGIMLWASRGDIDAGRSPKTTSSTQPPRLRFTPEGEIELVDLGGSIAGGGIAALQTNPAVEPGDTRLYAPAGTIRAGDAGIRAENLILTPKVEGGDNIQAGKVNVQLTASGPGAQVASAGDAASNAAKATEDNVKAGGRNTNDDGSAGAFLDVEVTGFGEIERVAPPAARRDARERDKR
ncbi:MAG TPA: filamentous hemagglutinin family protein, partial [Burkholderiales bacterium]|nr:filamentous hemagglutinin family protein [Burkholderiales bacterium]